MTNETNLKASTATETSTTPENKPEKPKGPIRIVGVVVLALVTAALYFGINPAIKFGLTKGLEAAFGATATVESVSVNWMPFTIDIGEVEQADKDNLERNLFQLEQVKIQARPFEYLLGNTVINDLSIKGLRFNQPREDVAELITSETVATDENPTEGTDVASQPKDDSIGLSIPSSEELLAGTELQTELKAKQLQQVWQTESNTIKSIAKGLPDKQAVKQYDEQWQAIEDTEIKSLDDLKQLKARVEKLKADINADRKKIKMAKQQYKTSKAKIDVAYEELKAAPGEDWQTIKQKLPIDDPNAVAISQLLFGDEVAEYLEQGLAVYEKAKPYIEKFSAKKEPEDKKPAPIFGRYIDFTLTEPMPKFIVLNTEVSFAVEDTDWSFTGQELTNESQVRNKPATFTANKIAKGSEALEVIGTYYAEPNKAFTAEGNWTLTGDKIVDYNIANDSDLSLQLQQANLSGGGTFDFIKTPGKPAELNSYNAFQFDQALFTGEGKGDFANLLLDSMTSINAFDIDVNAMGQLTAPKMSIDSDLDNRINSAFKSAFKTELNNVKQQTKADLQTKVRSQVEEKAPELQKLQNLEQEINQWESNLKDKAEEKLDKLLGDKKQALEDKLKKQAEDKIKDKVEDKLKDKLKDFKCCE